MTRRGGILSEMSLAFDALKPSGSAIFHSWRGFIRDPRIMTSAHVAALYFAGKKEAAKKRLQKLKAAGFVVNENAGERTRPFYI